MGVIGFTARGGGKAWGVEDRTPIRPASAEELSGDPFWAVVARRHPQLEVVLLPPEDPRPRQGRAENEDEIREKADRLVAAWRVLRPLVASIDVADPDRPPAVRWEVGDGDVLVIERAVIGRGQETGTTLLRAAAVALGQVGWVLRPALEDGLPLLDATDGTQHLEGRAGPGATVLTLTSPVPAAVADDRRRIRDEVRTAVAR